MFGGSTMVANGSAFMTSVENKTMTLLAHEGQIISLSIFAVTGFITSASHGKFVKL